MKKKTFKYIRFPLHKHTDLLQELRVAEQEFGELLSDKWDWVMEDSQMQKKALTGAKRLKALRLVLITHKLLNRTIQ